jgi:hypothetical protein
MAVKDSATENLIKVTARNEFFKKGNINATRLPMQQELTAL